MKYFYLIGLYLFYENWLRNEEKMFGGLHLSKFYVLRKLYVRKMRKIIRVWIASGVEPHADDPCTRLTFN